MIKKFEVADIKNLNDPIVFKEYSNTIDDACNNIDDNNPRNQRRVLIVFDDMVADIMTNKRFQAITKELFIRCKKVNISLVFIAQSYLNVPKEFILND